MTSPSSPGPASSWPVHGPAGAVQAAEVLGEAFLDDPVMAWLVPSGDRRARLTDLFGSFAATCSRTPDARLLLGGRSAGPAAVAALWLPPGAWHPSVTEQVRTFPRSLRAVRGGAVRALRLQAAVQRAHLREPHWYLWALGARPAARGTGVGSSVVQPVLDLCDDARLPAYLESSNPRNWTFYERHGFVRDEPLVVPAGCPPLVPFLRAPR